MTRFAPPERAPDANTSVIVTRSMAKRKAQEEKKTIQRRRGGLDVSPSPDTDDDTSSSVQSSSSEESIPTLVPITSQRLSGTKPGNGSESISADTESCNTSVEVVGKRGDKRKAAAAESGPRRKRRLDTENIKVEPNKENDNTSVIVTRSMAKRKAQEEKKTIQRRRGGLDVSPSPDTDDDTSSSVQSSSSEESIPTLVPITSQRLSGTKPGNGSESISADTDDDTSSSVQSSSSEESIPTLVPITSQRLSGTKPGNGSESISADTESCNTSVEVVGKRGDKRKAAAAESGPRRKRRLDTENIKVEPNKENDNTSVIVTRSMAKRKAQEEKKTIQRRRGGLDVSPSPDTDDDTSSSVQSSSSEESIPTLVPITSQRLSGTKPGNGSESISADTDDDTSSSVQSSSSEESIPTLVPIMSQNLRGTKPGNGSESTSADTDDDASSSVQSSSSEESIPTLVPITSQRLSGTKPGNGSASSSADTESCNTSVEVVGKRGDKRKAAAAESGPRRKRKRKRRLDSEVETSKQDEFDAKYVELDYISQGGCGTVYAGCRRADNLPVAIKHIPNENICCTHVDDEGNTISTEVAILLKLSAHSEGTSPHISMLDWYALEEELVVVMERPMPAEDMHDYIMSKGGHINEKEAKILLRQVVDAVLDLESKHIFHRDIKMENMLIEMSSSVPRVRLIDFGLSCFDERKETHGEFCGTLLTPEYYCNAGYRAGPTTVFQIGAVLFDALHKNVKFDTIRFYGESQNLPKRISKNCKNFLQMCLRVDPDDRPTLQELRNHQWLR